MFVTILKIHHITASASKLKDYVTIKMRGLSIQGVMVEKVENRYSVAMPFESSKGKAYSVIRFAKKDDYKHFAQQVFDAYWLDLSRYMI